MQILEKGKMKLVEKLNWSLRNQNAGDWGIARPLPSPEYSDALLSAAISAKLRREVNINELQKDF